MENSFKVLLIFIFFFHFENLYSQDTLILKITNLETNYPYCGEVSYETILYGKLVNEINPSATYPIHVSCPSFLNSLPRNSNSVYRVVVSKRFSKELFDPKEGVAYRLIDIRSVW